MPEEDAESKNFIGKPTTEMFAIAQWSQKKELLSRAMQNTPPARRIWYFLPSINFSAASVLSGDANNPAVMFGRVRSIIGPHRFAKSGPKPKETLSRFSLLLTLSSTSCKRLSVNINFAAFR